MIGKPFDLDLQPAPALETCAASLMKMQPITGSEGRDGPSTSPSCLIDQAESGIKTSDINKRDHREQDCIERMHSSVLHLSHQAKTVIFLLLPGPILRQTPDKGITRTSLKCVAGICPPHPPHFIYGFTCQPYG